MLSNSERNVFVAGCGMGILWIACFIGYIMNLIAFFRCDFGPNYKTEMIRGVGIVVPFVGAVTGYITIEDKPMVFRIENE